MNKNKIIIIITCILLISLSGCSNSFNSCYNTCKKNNKNNEEFKYTVIVEDFNPICTDWYYCIGTKIDNNTLSCNCLDKETLNNYCFKECKAYK